MNQEKFYSEYWKNLTEGYDEEQALEIAAYESDIQAEQELNFD